MIKVTNTPEYSAWAQAKGRCYNKNSPDYHRYGARGIIMCDRWLNSFHNFLSDMGNRPSSKHSIDRIENNGNYEPGNCRWTLKKDQQNNTRSNVMIKFNGETRTLKQWCERLNVKYHLVYLRMNKLKWPFELAISLPSDPVYNPRKRKKRPTSV